MVSACRDEHPLGLDGGPVVQIGAGDVYVGGQFRLMLTAGYVALYARQGFVPADPIVSRFTEAGALLKLPIRL